MSASLPDRAAGCCARHEWQLLSSNREIGAAPQWQLWAAKARRRDGHRSPGHECCRSITERYADNSSVNHSTNRSVSACRSRAVLRSTAWVRNRLIAQNRDQEGREKSTSVAIIDSQSVKTSPDAQEAVGFDAGKRIKGRKYYPLFDRFGLLRRVEVYSADVQDRDGTALLADRTVARILFVERIFSRIIIKRCLTKDFARFTTTIQTLIRFAMIKLMSRRVACYRTYEMISRNGSAQANGGLP